MISAPRWVVSACCACAFYWWGRRWPASLPTVTTRTAGHAVRVCFDSNWSKVGIALCKVVAYRYGAFLVPKLGRPYTNCDEVGHKCYEVGQKYYEVGQQSYEVGQQSYEVGQESYEVGQESYEVGQESYEVGQESYEVGQKYYGVGRNCYEVALKCSVVA